MCTIDTRAHKLQLSTLSSSCQQLSAIKRVRISSINVIFRFLFVIAFTEALTLFLNTKKELLSDTIKSRRIEKLAIQQLTSIDDHAIIEDKVRLVITSCLCQFSQRDFPKSFGESYYIS